MKNKVQNLAQEVFDEVVEHEMALAGLTNVNLDDIMPPPASPDMNKTHKSLLRRMTMIQTNLKRRMSGHSKLPRMNTSLKSPNNISEISESSSSSAETMSPSLKDK